ncbi:ATP-binding protein [Magnetospirillum sp. SS-4]|uniref:PAS domain-containing sensor histidine kinase n=1 Tax=Magnetospirillum sp. SS-4 TaxID=2681465 RepID=UPI00138626E6|nr:ATP-binding protein [Magnetospirillum sp. SS-4]CAA7616182.1 Nodulation protein V [Magnetospirillum sp. SS-4]
MTGPRKTKAQLEAEIAGLQAELGGLRATHPEMSDIQRRMAETLHSLQVHQEELRAQNEDLRITQGILESTGYKYHELFESSPAGYFIICDRFTVVDVNIAGLGMLGRAKGRIAGKPFLLFVDRDSRPVLDHHFRLVRGGDRASSEIWITPEGREPFPVILESVALRRGWGDDWRCLSTALDITARKRAEMALRASEARFRAIFEQSPLAMEIIDAAGRTAMANPAWNGLWEAPDHASLKPRIAEALKGRGVEIAPMAIPSEADPSANRWVRGYVYPIRQGDNGAIHEAVVVHEDITERVRAEATLAERTERLCRQHDNLRVLSEIAALPTSAPAPRMALALDLARRHLGLDQGIVSHVDRGRYVIEHHASDGPCRAGEVFDLASTYCELVVESNDVIAIPHMGRSPHADHPCYRARGLESYIGAPIRCRGDLRGTVSFSAAQPNRRDFDDGDREFMRLLARWIGAVQEEEATLRDLAQSNADLEQFAYVASHDLRQPLRQISSYVALLERRYGASLDQDAHDFIAFARQGAVRMDRLIVDLLEYSRIGRNAAPGERADLNRVMAEALGNIGAALSACGGRVMRPDSLPAIRGNHTDLVRLFQNLLDNAVKYRDSDRPPVIEITARPHDNHLTISVADNGIGIAPDYFDTIFRVFQRLHTPDKYEGTGIGLAICKKVVDQHQGTIRVDSVPGRGSTFHVTLPSGL